MLRNHPSPFLSMTPAVTEVLLIMQPLFREFAHPGIFATATSWVLWPLSPSFTYLYVCPHVPPSEFLLSAQLHLLLPCCSSTFPLPGPQPPSLLTSFLGPQLVPSPSPDPRLQSPVQNSLCKVRPRPPSLRGCPGECFHHTVENLFHSLVGLAV